MHFPLVSMFICVSILFFSTSVLSNEDKTNKYYSDNGRAIEFELDFGGRYKICRDYVEMLNQLQYAEFPKCNWKIDFEFSKFRDINWKTVTDESLIKRVLDFSVEIKLYKLYDPDGQRRKNAYRAYDFLQEKVGDPKVFHARIDMDYDGGPEDVYRVSWAYDGSYTCDETVRHVVLDSSNSFKEYYIKGFKSLNSGVTHYRLFYYDGRVYKDFWEGFHSRHLLRVDEIYAGVTPICGINIKK